MEIGILTYHAAYNYGSVLQAFATQEIIKQLGYKAEIINYRMDEQKKFYKLYRPYYGIRFFAKDLMQIPVHSQRMLRAERFEKFFQTYFSLSKEYSSPNEIYFDWSKYSMIVSGSDQIWNKHSQELEHNSWKYMFPYLLREFQGRKISYASSIGNMTDEELNVIIKDINAFDYVSMREKVSSARLEQLLHKSIKTVLDPTFLLKNNEWISKLKLHKKEEEKYILYYSLLGIKPLKQMVQILKIVAQNKKNKLRIITPFAYLNLNDEVIEIHPEYGPIEFLESIYNAQAVYTNSYHGTILSVNFNKDIYSLCEDSGTEFRKTDILKRLGLADRIIYDPLVLLQDNFKPIDYDDVNKKISNYREDSILYLKNALS